MRVSPHIVYTGSHFHSSSLTFLTQDDIRRIDRFREPPDEGLMCELLWSDPSPLPGRTPSKRGVGVAFGPDVTRKFLEVRWPLLGLEGPDGGAQDVRLTMVHTRGLLGGPLRCRVGRKRDVGMACLGLTS